MKPVSLRVLAFLVLLLPTFGQVHSGTAIQNSSGNWLKAIPGASIYLCSSSATDAACIAGTGGVRSTIYTDATLSVTTTQPVRADSNGNYTLYASSGIFRECVVGATSKCDVIE